MDDIMSAYFRELIRRLARQKILRLYFLEVRQRPAATVLCFDYNGTRYLYNNGYDAAYHDLSVGILSKIFSIREAIEVGCRKYDFLKGDEVYKKRIGGRAVPLYQYVAEL
jgi:CelD/BcsL family acetyltransferase involved in cellulose biosynthesis